MIETAEGCRPLLRCPRTGAMLTFGKDGSASTGGGAHHYPVADGLPVLIDFERSVVGRRDVFARHAESAIPRHRYVGVETFFKRLLSPPKPETRVNVARLIASLKALKPNPRVLVIGGGTVGQGMQPLYDDPALKVIAFDIYRSAHAHFIADAHAIPLADRAIDGVVVQAVLEHVLQPDRVVAEIWRVLADDGLVYAETPFLQHVHEGAYDFTRFTESGHRYLFRRFALIASGPCGGVGTQLVWSIDYFVRSLFRSRAAGKVAKLAFFWLQYFDRIIPAAYASDAASGVFFLGRKSADEITPAEILDFYRGAQKRR